MFAKSSTYLLVQDSWVVRSSEEDPADRKEAGAVSLKSRIMHALLTERETLVSSAGSCLQSVPRETGTGGP